MAADEWPLSDNPFEGPESLVPARRIDGVKSAA